MRTIVRPQLGFWMTVSAVVFSAAAIAQAQSHSPFANKKKTQAWETAAPAVRPAPAPTGSYQQPTSHPPSYQLPSAQQTAPARSHYPVSGQGNYVAPKSYQPAAAAAQSPATQSSAGQSYGSGYNAPVSGPSTAQQYSGHETGAYYPGRSDKGQAILGQHYNREHYQGRGYTAQTQNYPHQTYGQNHGQNYEYTPQQTQRRSNSWGDKLGLRNLATSVTGFLKFGAAATDRDSRDGDGWSEDFIADGKINAEVSAITSGGLEYGIGAELRGQYDRYRRGFGGRVGDCPASVTGCASTLIAGVPTAVRGHTSQFYTDGPSNAKEEEFALEGAYLFLRSAYGDISVGRDDGAAYLFSLGAPSLLAINASNSGVDYTGLDSVKTVNDASGFAEKITYTSPRLLGDTVGVGVQFGVSYALDARACGVDYCVRDNGRDGSGALAPDLEDVIEAGLSLDRNFDNGLRIEATATYATASEESGIAAFDDLKSFGLGLELGYGDWTLGGSYLDSNNALQDGDYTAYDVGLTWKPGDWGVTLGYGHAEDKNINLESDQAVLGFTYDWGKYRLGTGVQYIERDVPIAAGGLVLSETEKATSIFIEGGITF